MHDDETLVVRSQPPAPGDRTLFVSLLPNAASAGPINKLLTILDDGQPSVVQFAVTDLPVEEDVGIPIATLVLIPDQQDLADVCGLVR